MNYRNTIQTKTLKKQFSNGIYTLGSGFSNVSSKPTTSPSIKPTINISPFIKPGFGFVTTNHSTSSTSSSTTTSTSTSTSTSNMIDTTKYQFKKALLVGITYSGNLQLDSSVYDLQNFHQYLLDIGFSDSEIIIMNENAGQNSINYPSRINILNAMNNLVNFSNANHNSFIVFYYSGHGTQIQQKYLVSQSSYTVDEAIVPVDFLTNGVIIDQVIRNNFIQLLHSSSTLFAIIDACNSGTALDLKYGYIVPGIDYTHAIRTINDVSDKSTCMAISISACKDNQTSVATKINQTDTYIQSVLTWSFLNSYKNVNSLAKLLQSIQSLLFVNFCFCFILPHS